MNVSIEVPDAKTGFFDWFQNSSDSVWSVDQNLRLINFNISCRKMMERFYGANIISGMSVMQLCENGSAAEWEKYYRRTLAGECFSVEMKLRHNAHDYYYDIVFSPVLVNHGVEGVTVCARDITSRKKAEGQLNYKIDELNTFMFRATHDLRSPLVSLMGLVHLAKDDLQQEASPGLIKYFDMIGKSVEKMDKLLIDLVDITNVSQGKLMINKVDFQKMSTDIIESLHHYPNFENITIRKIINDNVPFYTDDRLLYSVLQNLIDNAIKYSRSGNVIKPLISVIIECTEQSAVINIIDNGIGITDKLQEKVFDMFYRVSGTSSAGTGLGLYIVKTAVERIGGKIFLASKEFEGTSIYIRLPNFKNTSG